MALWLSVTYLLKIDTLLSYVRLVSLYIYIYKCVCVCVVLVHSFGSGALLDQLVIHCSLYNKEGI